MMLFGCGGMLAAVLIATGLITLVITALVIASPDRRSRAKHAPARTRKSIKVFAYAVIISFVACLCEAEWRTPVAGGLLLAVTLLGILPATMYAWLSKLCLRLPDKQLSARFGAALGMHILVCVLSIALPGAIYGTTLSIAVAGAFVLTMWIAYLLAVLTSLAKLSAALAVLDDGQDFPSENDDQAT